MIFYSRGIVSFGDTYRSKYSDKKGYIWIGDEDILSVVHHEKWNEYVYCKIIENDKETLFYGKLLTDPGFRHSSYPKETDFLHVGNVDILHRLSKYKNKEVTFILSNEEVFL